MWWRTTPVATKARHHGAGGADTHARPAPTTSKDEGCQVLLHRLRTSSRHTPSSRTWIYLSLPSTLIYELFRHRTCLAVRVYLSLSLGFLVDPPFRAPLKKPTHLWTFLFIYVKPSRFMHLKRALSPLGPFCIL